MSEEWKEVSPSTDKMWEYQKEGDEIIGQYVAKNPERGPNKSNIYVLENEEGKIGVWGTTVLDSRFSGIAIGDFVKIVYLGTVQGGGPRPYKNFKVYTKSGESRAMDMGEPYESIPI